MNIKPCSQCGTNRPPSVQQHSKKNPKWMPFMGEAFDEQEFILVLEMKCSECGASIECENAINNFGVLQAWNDPYQWKDHPHLTFHNYQFIKDEEIDAIEQDLLETEKEIGGLVYQRIV